MTKKPEPYFESSIPKKEIDKLLRKESTVAKAKLDKDKLKELAEQGGSLDDICKNLGATKLAVKTALTELMLNEGRVYSITDYKAKTAGYTPPTVARVGKKGNITISKRLLTEMDPAEGEEYDVEVDAKNNKITLTPHK